MDAQQSIEMDKQSKDATLRRSQQTQLENLRGKVAAKEELSPREKKIFERLEKALAVR
jgi:hypothetical protein